MLLGASHPASPPDPILLEGFVSVEAAISSRCRPVHTVYVDESKKAGPSIKKLCEAAPEDGIAVEIVPRSTVEEMASGRTHGGIVASVGERKFCLPDDLLEDPDPFIVMLDGIEDPFVFGYAVRALHAAGVTGLVVRSRTWGASETIVARASAGASELIRTALTDGPNEAADLCRSRGLHICATGRCESTASIYDADWTVPTFLLIGGERRGIQRSFLENADAVYAIPYGQEFPRSLGTASACAVIAFEAARQRKVCGR